MHFAITDQFNARAQPDFYSALKKLTEESANANEMLAAYRRRPSEKGTCVGSGISDATFIRNGICKMMCALKHQPTRKLTTDL